MQGLPYDLDQFDYTCNDFVAESKRHSKDAPLFSEDETPDPGNRCLPGRRFVLLLALFRRRSNVTQDALGVLFDVDQSTVCRYLRFADSVLAGILLTADRMARLVKKAETSEQLEKDDRPVRRHDRGVSRGTSCVYRPCKLWFAVGCEKKAAVT